MTGRLIYVIGASGSGKDTLIKIAANALINHSEIRFVRRCITRPADPDGENHLPLTPEDFNTHLQGGLFAMHWSGNGYYYGIGVEIDSWLDSGQTVVVNGSRQWLTEARARYPDLVPIMIEVSASVLRQRLFGRGRESAAEIETRLKRHQQMHPRLDQCVIINNDGHLNVASKAFIDVICQTAGG